MIFHTLDTHIFTEIDLEKILSETIKMMKNISSESIKGMNRIKIFPTKNIRTSFNFKYLELNNVFKNKTYQNAFQQHFE